MTVPTWVPALLAAALLAGCGGAPPPAAPPPPASVDVTLRADADTNAGPDGKGAPVAIRLYQLAGPAAFEAAPFFSLFDKDADALKADLVKRDDVLLPPGRTMTLALAPEDKVRAIGVFAGFRDYEHVVWRAVVAVPPHQASVLTVTAGRAGITAKIAPAAKAAAAKAPAP